MNYLNKEHLPMRIIWACFFAFMFTMIGLTFPEFYFKYLDRTEYYTIEQPISVDKITYTPCEKTILTIKRNSLVNTVANSAIDLNLVKADGKVVRILDAHITVESSIAKGSKIIDVAFTLPCDLDNGTYFWQGTIVYRVRKQEKFYPFITENFQVARVAGKNVQVTTTPKPQSTQNGVPQNNVQINNSFENPKSQPTPQSTPQPGFNIHIPLPTINLDFLNNLGI